MTMNINFRFHDPTDNFTKTGNRNIETPGTKVTPKMAGYVAENFLKQFEDMAPAADLRSAKCTVAGTGQKVFDMEFHVKPSSEINEGTQP